MREVMRTVRRSLFFIVVAALLTPALAAAQPPPPEPLGPAPVPPPSGAPGGLKIEGTNASVKLGFLLQPGFEYDSGTDTTTNKTISFFLRRARLMVGMSLGTQIELFAETDAPNLGRATGVSGNPGVNMQDAYATWKPLEELKVDAGMMLIPLSHNGLQGATTLYGWDYYAFSFLQSGGLTNYVGRDTGVQLRGLIINHLEYRLGLFQGKRSVPEPPAAPPSRTPLRIAGRLQYNILDPETAYFYAGTYTGTKKVASVGLGFDHQDGYTAVAADAFVDYPIGNDVVTAQLDVVHYDGGTWIALAKQTDIMAEAGYRFGGIRLSPIVRIEEQAPTAGSNLLRVGGGVAWWPMNHNFNLKLFYTLIKPSNDALRSVSQLNLQMQFYVF